MWKKLKILGAGTSGTVYLAAALNSSTNPLNLAAVKSADLHASSALQTEAMFLGELRGNPNIIQCFGEDRSFEKNQQVYNLLLEYAPGGSLTDLIEKNKATLPETHVVCYTYMLLNGISAMHECQTIHCDIKPDNILVFPKKNSVVINQLKIADFGLAKKSWENDEFRLCHGGGGNNNRFTPLYASPEAVMGGEQGAASDIWSLGCVVAEMMSGEPVWPREIKREDLLIKLMRGAKPPLPENMSEDGKDFLRRCFERAVHRRCTADMLLDHPFIVKNLQFLDRRQNDEDVRAMKNPFSFGFGGWLSTYGLFTASSMDCSSHFECQNLTSLEVEESEEEARKYSFPHLSDSEVSDLFCCIS